MTRRLYRRFCEALYRLDQNGRPHRFRRLAYGLRLTKALFDDHGTFHDEKDPHAVPTR